MTNILKITNLPPGITTEKIRNALNKVGTIVTIEIPYRSYNSIVYDLGIAYVMFTEENIFDYYLNQPNEVIIDGYFCEVTQCQDSKEISSCFLLGIAPHINEKDLFYALQFTPDISVQIEGYSTSTKDSFAIIHFPSPEQCHEFLRYQQDFIVKSCQIHIEPYPQFSSRIVTISPQENQNQHFQPLRNLERFNDFHLLFYSSDFLLFIGKSLALIKLEIPCYDRVCLF